MHHFCCWNFSIYLIEISLWLTLINNYLLRVQIQIIFLLLCSLCFQHNNYLLFFYISAFMQKTYKNIYNIIYFKFIFHTNLILHKNPLSNNNKYFEFLILNDMILRNYWEITIIIFIKKYIYIRRNKNKIILEIYF